MSQYWGPPSYPPRPPQYQPPPLEPDYYYEPDKGSTTQNILYFLAGSCSTIVLMACCVTTLAWAWAADNYFGIINILTLGQTLPNDVVAEGTNDLVVNPVEVQVPVTDTVQTSETVFGIGDPVIADDIALELTALDIQRNVQPNNIASGDGLEFVAVSVFLCNQPQTALSNQYAFQNFQLQNEQNEFYQPDPQADNGRLLGSGELLPAEGEELNCIEGDVLFEIRQGENPLHLIWQATNSQEVHTIRLQ